MKIFSFSALLVSLILLSVVAVSATTVIEDISYEYYSGMLSETEAKFAEAAQHYTICIDLAGQNNKTVWKEFCQSQLDIVTKINPEKTRDIPALLQGMGWVFKGEIAAENETVQYFLTAENDFVIVRVYKLGFSADEKDVAFLLSLQKANMENYYNVQQSNFTYKESKVQYLTGKQKGGELSNFFGMYFDKQSGELVTISASVSDTDKFLENFGVYKTTGLPEIAIYAVVVIVIIIIILVFIKKRKR